MAPTGQQPSVWLEFSPLAGHLGCVNLGQGFPDWDPPDFIQQAAARAVQGGACSKYARSAGHPRLVQAIAGAYGPRLEREIHPETDVLVTVGASEAIFLSVMGHVRPGDEVIVFEPAFDIYYGALAMAGAVVRPVSLLAGDDGKMAVDLAGLRAMLSPRTRAMIINTPHNPGGMVMDRPTLEKIDQALRDYPDCVVIADEVYEHLVYGDAVHTPVATVGKLGSRTLSIYSAGKNFSVTGWKIGWVIAPQELLAPLQIAQQWVVFSVATPLQEAVAEALERGGKPYGGAADYYGWLRQSYDRKRELLLAGLGEVGLEPMAPDGSFFILCRIAGQPEEAFAFPEEIRSLHRDGVLQMDTTTTGRRDYNFCRNLSLHHGVTAIPASAFFSPQTAAGGADWVRFAFCKEEAVLREAVKRLTAKTPFPAT